MVSRHGHLGVYHRWRDPVRAEALQTLRRHLVLDPEEIAGIQRRKLRALVDHAYTTVPYYRRLFDSCGVRPADVHGPEDLRSLPVLTKQIIQRCGDDLRATSIPPSHGAVRQERTGGSTGDPLRFWHADYFRSLGFANLQRSHEMCGWQPGDRRAYLAGLDRRRQSWRDRLEGWGANQLALDVLNTTEDELEAFAVRLRRFRPELVIGYVSALVSFAQVIENRRLPPLRPTAIQTTSETLTSAQRGILHAAFACPVFESYGSRELLNVAHECGAHEGLHVFSDLHVVEVVDEFDRPSSPGVPGRIVITPLDNYAMPFLRYDIGDVVTEDVVPCRCGLPFPRLASIEGRVTDIIVTPAGRLLQDEFFTRIIYSYPGVLRFQVRQEVREEIRIALVVAAEFDGASLEAIERRIHADGDAALRVEFAQVDDIPRSPLGKLRTTISSIAPGT